MMITFFYLLGWESKSDNLKIMQQQQHSYHSDIYIVFIHTDRRILTSEGRSGKASGSAAAVWQIICWVSSSILILLQTGDILE